MIKTLKHQNSSICNVLKYKKLISRLFILALSCFTMSNGIAQVIWSEDFNSYADGAKTSVDGKWIMDHSHAIPCGTFEIRNHQVYAQWSADTISHLGMNVWISDTIDISAYPYVQVSFDAQSGGSLDPYDTIRATYQVDDGAEALFFNQADDLPLTTVNYKGISGSSLIVRVYFRSSNAHPASPPEEEHWMDNVEVSVDPTIYQELFSRGGTLNWNNDTSWSLSSGGVSCGFIPDSNTIVTIENSSTVTVSAAAVAKEVSIETGNHLIVNSTLDLCGNGGLSNNASAVLSGTGELRFRGPGYLSFTNLGIISLANITSYGPGYLNVNNSGTMSAPTLRLNGPVQVDLNNTGTMTFNSLYFNANCSWLDIYGPNQVLVQGSFYNSSDYNIFLIRSSGNIRINVNFNCGNRNMYLKNYGHIEQAGRILSVKDSITLSDTLYRARFYNYENAVYDYSGDSIDKDLKFYANYNNNTVIYSSNGNQRIMSARDSYYNLIIRGSSGTKTLTNNLVINNDLTIENSRTLDVSANNYSITLKGDWSNAGTFTSRAGTVYLTGSALQTISNSANESFYNLSVNNTNGGIQFCNGNVTVTNNLSMISGNVNTASYRLILGTSTASIGVLSHTSGAIIGAFQRWVNTTGTTYQFPVGSATNTNTMSLNFTQLNSGTVTTRFHISDPGGTGLPILTSTDTVDLQFTEGYWSLLPENGLTTSDYNISLAANGFSSYTIVPSTRIISRINSGNWIDPIPGTHQAVTGLSVNRVHLTNGISASLTEYGLATNSNTTTARFSDTNVQTCIDNPLATLSVILTGTGPWEIAVSRNGATAVVHSAIATSPFEFDVTQAGTYTITRVTTAGGDGIVSGYPAIVTFNNLPNPIISGNANLCPNASDQIYTTIDNVLHSYHWDITGGLITAGQDTHEISVDWGDGSVSSSLIVTETIGSTGCSGKDTLQITFGIDNTNPSISCSAVPTNVSAGVNCTNTLADLRSNIIASDNCTSHGNLIISQSPVPNTVLNQGGHTLTFTVTDEAGNSNSCNVVLSVEDNTNPTIVCPSAISVSTDSGSCIASGVDLGTPITSDNCSVSYISNNATADFTSGIHSITWVVTDGSGNTAQCQQTVTVTDNQAPEISCPDPVFMQPTLDSCMAIIPDLTVSLVVMDNCSAFENIALSQDPIAGTIVTTGIKHVIITATDEAGHQSTCDVVLLVMPIESEGITAWFNKK